MSEFRGPDPKPGKRVKDKALMKRLHTRGVICVLCGKPGSLHHIYPRGQGGDDLPENLVGLCGHGTSGEHGLVESGDVATLMELGLYIVDERPDVVVYLQTKLGEEAGLEWLRRKFYAPL